MQEKEFAEYLSVTKVMEVLKLSRPTVLKMIVEKELKGVRFRDQYKVAKKTLQDYVKNMEV